MIFSTRPSALRLGVATAAAALVLPALPAAGSPAGGRPADAAPPTRTLDLACPADRVTGEGFRDTAGSVHEDSIRCLAWYGIAQGAADGTYAGERAVTRAQLATFLGRVLEHAGVELPELPADAFSDDEASAHEHSLNVLAALGIVKGDAAGDVNPDDAVRRDQMASLLVRLLELVEGEDVADAVEDYFDDDADNVHAGAINALAGLGIAAGRTEGVFAPGAEVLREQLATFLMRLVDRLVEQDEVRVPLTLRLSAEEVAPGDVVTGSVTGDDIGTVALAGCGVDGDVVDEQPDVDGVQFSFTVPAAAPVTAPTEPVATEPAPTGPVPTEPVAAELAAADASGAPGDGHAPEGPDEGSDDECELQVIVTYASGGEVVLEAELEHASADDEGADDEGADDEGADEGTDDEGADAGGTARPVEPVAPAVPGGPSV